MEKIYILLKKYIQIILFHKKKCNIPEKTKRDPTLKYTVLKNLNNNKKENKIEKIIKLGKLIIYFYYYK